MQENKAKSGSLKRNLITIMVFIIVVVIASGAAALKLFGIKDENPADGMATFVVKQGPLRIDVTESGTIEAREQEVIKNEVEGRTTILSLVPEGTVVKKGDLLVELDASQLEDDKIDQEIKVQNDDAEVIQARENLAVVENQAQSDIDIAKLTLEFAKQDLKKYIEGEYPNQLKEAEARITLAKEELEDANENLEWSRKLYNEKYISETELKRDELAVSKARLDLEIAERDKNLLEEFTYKREVAQLESDVKQAKMALERTNRKAKADIVQAQAKLRAKESEYKQQQDKLIKIEDQISKTKIYAPADGLVIYATSAKIGGFRHFNQEPLEEGQEVREREELIYLPTALAMKAAVKIHESSMKKVELGLPARITVDALPGKVFGGKVMQIAPLPDAVSMWLNPDLKVYSSEIYIDSNDSELRTGMSCKVEIIIEEYKNVTYIPLQAIVRIKGKPTVYVADDKSIEPREVEVGLDNNRMVRITSGLEAGETILLNPPLAAGTVEQAAEITETEGVPVEEQEGMREEVTEGQPEQKSIEGGSKKRENMRKRFEQMSPEERKKMRERLEKMSPEEREKMLQQQRKNRPQGSEGK